MDAFDELLADLMKHNLLLNPGLTQVKQINNDFADSRISPTCPVNVVPEADKYGCR